MKLLKKLIQMSVKITWMEIYAGEKANLIYGGDTWLPKKKLLIVLINIRVQLKVH